MWGSAPFIQLVGKAKNESMTRVLVEFLLGGKDRVPKDPNYLMRLYLALGNYAQAANTSLVISRKEQEEGNYKQAKVLLLEAYSDLRKNKIRVPSELQRNLMLLHSYIVVKVRRLRCCRPTLSGTVPFFS